MGDVGQAVRQRVGDHGRRHVVGTVVAQREGEEHALAHERRRIVDRLAHDQVRAPDDQLHGVGVIGGIGVARRGRDDGRGHRLVQPDGAGQHAQAQGQGLVAAGGHVRQRPLAEVGIEVATGEIPVQEFEPAARFDLQDRVVAVVRPLVGDPQCYRHRIPHRGRGIVDREIDGQVGGAHGERGLGPVVAVVGIGLVGGGDAHLVVQGGPAGRRRDLGRDPQRVGVAGRQGSDVPEARHGIVVRARRVVGRVRRAGRQGVQGRNAARGAGPVVAHHQRVDDGLAGGGRRVVHRLRQGQVRALLRQHRAVAVVPRVGILLVRRDDPGGVGCRIARAHVELDLGGDVQDRGVARGQITEVPEARGGVVAAVVGRVRDVDQSRRQCVGGDDAVGRIGALVGGQDREHHLGALHRRRIVDVLDQVQVGRAHGHRHLDHGAADLLFDLGEAEYRRHVHDGRAAGSRIHGRGELEHAAGPGRQGADVPAPGDGAVGSRAGNVVDVCQAVRQEVLDDQAGGLDNADVLRRDGEGDGLAHVGAVVVHGPDEVDLDTFHVDVHRGGVVARVRVDGVRGEDRRRVGDQTRGFGGHGGDEI